MRDILNFGFREFLGVFGFGVRGPGRENLNFAIWQLGKGRIRFSEILVNGGFGLGENWADFKLADHSLYVHFVERVSHDCAVCVEVEFWVLDV